MDFGILASRFNQMTNNKMNSNIFNSICDEEYLSIVYSWYIENNLALYQQCQRLKIINASCFYKTDTILDEECLPIDACKIYSFFLEVK